MARFRKLAACATAALGIAWAQFGSGIQGTILDRSSSVIAGAAVRVTNIDTGVSRDVLSSELGVYRVPSLSPGNYRVSVTKVGFASSEQESVPLGVDEIRKVDFALDVGSVRETVSVTGKPTILETEEGRISGRIESTQVRELPIANRNVYNLVALQPGVTGRSLSNDVAGGRTGANIYASGQRKDANSFSLDNMSTNSVSAGGNAEITPNVESVEEVRVVANNFSAEEGRNPGAHVSVISKAGTNEYHGSVWDYFQNNTLSARNFFDTASVPVFRRNQFGGAFGGPVFKNRTFFFFTYEGTRQSGGSTTTATVETSQFRDFVMRTRPNSIAAKLFDQFRPVADPSFNLRDLGSPSPGVNVWNSTPDGIPDIGTARFIAAADTVSNQYTIRLDHELRPGKDRLYAYYYHARGTPRVSPIRPEFFRWTTTTGYFGNVNHTHIFTPSMLNEFRAAITRYDGIYTVPQHLEVPQIDITGATGMQNTNNSPGYGTPYYPGGWFPTEYMAKDSFSWIKGGHVIKFGGEVRRAQNNLKHTRSYLPSYTFASILDFADDEALQMSRTVDPRTGNPTITDCAQRIWETGFFVQDDWKIRRDFTINIGLRHEYFGAFTDATNKLRNFLPGPGSNSFEQIANGKVDVVHDSWPANHLDFGPRFGFAWDVGGKGRNVVRAGYGLSYDRLPTVTPASYRDSPPLTAVVTLGALFGTPFTYTLGNPSQPYLGYPVDPGLRAGLDEHNGIRGVRVTLVGVDRNFRQPYTHNWFFSLQRSLPGQIVVEASYIGSAGHHLINIADVNRYSGDLLDGRFDGLNPSFSSISMSQTNSDSIYNGGTVSVRRHFSRGFSLQAAYTYGKAIADGDQSGTVNYYDVNNRKLDRSVTSYDVPQRLALTGIWNLPFLLNCHSILCRTVGGWQLSGYSIFEKGLPLTIVSSASYPRGDFNADGTTGSDRPNAPPDSLQRDGFSNGQFLAGIFKVSDFPLPARGQTGDLGRNTFRGPGFARVDLSLAKAFALGERIKLAMRLEAFNALNRVNLLPPSTDLNNNNFGKVTAAEVPRSLQVSLQLRF